ncbi:transporter substrate-binding domain-containing protein [Candidatus Bathyarchaeota archaeon]|nr:transporter substrate-binding domain-containing protein [Candidatus Bathyarchaeota archaeon]
MQADQAGSIDVFITDYVPAEALVKKVEGLKIAYHAEVSTGPVLIIMPEGDVVLTAEINKIIADLLKEGFIDQLSVKHIGQ